MRLNVKMEIETDGVETKTARALYRKTAGQRCWKLHATLTEMTVNKA